MVLIMQTFEKGGRLEFQVRLGGGVGFRVDKPYIT